jgi:hypothetical protein
MARRQHAPAAHGATQRAGAMHLTQRGCRWPILLLMQARCTGPHAKAETFGLDDFASSGVPACVRDAPQALLLPAATPGSER